MTEKESALLSVAADQQGSNTNTGSNVISVFDNVKSMFEKDQEYLKNTFTRFQLLSFAQKHLVFDEIISKNKNYAKCHISTLGALASLVRNPQTDRAYYNSVVTCGNSKLCPVCAPRVMGKRSVEIRQGVHAWLNESPENTCYMLTLTFAHTIDDSLDFLLKRSKEALQIFWRNGSVRRIFSFSGRVGRITSTEIQYSRKNGFHPHQHILLFCKKSFIPVEELRRHWIAALESVGLAGLSDIALDLIEARAVENYLTKISSEMAMGNIKQGRVTGHYSPMQILFEAANDSTWALSVFYELFRGMRGMHSLYWSPGLKKRFGINELSDDAIARGEGQAELEQFMDILGFSSLSFSDKALLRNYAAFNDWDRASALLESRGVQYWEKYQEN